MITCANSRVVARVAETAGDLTPWPAASPVREGSDSGRDTSPPRPRAATAWPPRPAGVASGPVGAGFKPAPTSSRKARIPLAVGVGYGGHAVTAKGETAKPRGEVSLAAFAGMRSLVRRLGVNRLRPRRRSRCRCIPARGGRAARVRPARRYTRRWSACCSRGSRCRSGRPRGRRGTP